MTGKTSTRTYALIAGPASGDFSFQWTATIFRNGYRCTAVARAYIESSMVNTVL